MLHTQPKAILFTALVAGTLDLIAATIQFMVKTGKDPVIILQYIASAIFGPEAFTSKGYTMPLTGLLLHYTVALLFTMLFYLLRKNFRQAGYYPLITGIVYGLFVWCVMNLAVVPLSRAPVQPLTITGSVQAAIILICCIGIPVSLMANKHYLYKKK